MGTTILGLSIPAFVYVIVNAIGVSVLVFYADRLRDNLRKSREELEDAYQLMATLEDLNYRLACQLHGRDAVDAAIKKAEARGKN